MSVWGPKKPPVTSWASAVRCGFCSGANFLNLVKSRRFEQTAALGGLYLVEKIFGIDPLEVDLQDLASALAAVR